ncbi:asparagine synthase (glutamine-hydrolyzing) [Oceanotoga sp. DSM 15011]|uniref:asparagine synthase (glutamine-hydrolyzing) n=1 Tax=Oceanotoga sp. DSM 15011 TaxID=2984951 RepID=UPI0021F494B9|nr:asparagine synthase (glutamine-hydrolyzing) [Oceanotoga sp. DSM 15011]UYP00914.1 asparagine synthase (glutamine-hydrolyzing) [Oceanotoga sp. DSM 15011]
MCGIAGVLSFRKEPISTLSIKKMIDSIKHRGPDAEGIYVEDFFGVGHRRLSILDLTNAAHQPMISKDKNYVLSYNGEIYNFQELRLELESLGYVFRSNSDTEVVLNSYIEWKEECLNKFNGMFAFSVWNKKEKRLFLARDRYGIKPLYYYNDNKKFIFASEQKAILTQKINRDIDLETVCEYFTFQNIFTNKTMFKNIKILEPGHYLYVDLNKFETNITQYWDFYFYDEKSDRSEEDYLEELDFLFKRAVKRQLISDVEIGSYLSGGIDSGSITSIASIEYPYLKTFTCGFDLSSASGLELYFDEREKAEYMSYLFKTEHYEMVLKSDDMERILPKLSFYLEEPRVGQSYPNYYISQLASKFVKVVLSGTGGDELFGGYPWRYFKVSKDLNSFEKYIDKYYLYWQRLIPNRIIKEVFSPIYDDIKHVSTKEIFKNVFKNINFEMNTSENFINNSLYFEAKTFLHGLLIVEDKLSMANSLETRVPFLDNDLVDFAQKLPVKYKINNLSSNMKLNENEPGNKREKYYKKTNDGKLILRKMANKYIPNSISNGNKQGFSAPDSTWFKGESINYVKKIIYNNSSKIYNFMDEKIVRNLVNEHLTGEKNRRLLIWSLLSFEEMLKIFF